MTRRLRAFHLPVAVGGLALVLSACSSSASDGSAAEAVRTVKTSIGTVSVPEKIESVVVLEGRRDLDIVLSLGLPLAGFPYEGPESGLDLKAPLADATAAAEADGAEKLFLADEINLEAIIEADPTVIVGRAEDVEPILDELQAIAPVIPVGSHDEGVTWQDDLRLVAEATGTETRADELIAEHDAAIAALKQKYPEQIAQTTVAAIGYDLETTEVQATRLQSIILTELGATPSKAFADAAADTDSEGQEFSPERTLEAHGDAEAILVLADTADEWKATETDRLWQQLPAVAAGHVVRSDKMTHEGGPITAAHVLTLLDELYGLV